METSLPAAVKRAQRTFLRLFLVVIALATPSLAAAQSEPSASGTTIYIANISYEPYGCDFTSEERALEDLFLHDSDQHRVGMVCNSVLAEVARNRAEDMAARSYLSHTNPDGYGPNYLIQAAGYPLPSYYSQNINANNVESIGGGYTTAQDVWNAWRNSDHHRSHVLGLSDFYSEQVEYGIGYAYSADSLHHFYWVLITAHPDEE